MRWRRPVEGQLDAAVGEALAVEPVGEPELPQQLDGRVLEHAGPHAVLDVGAVALLEHDAVDAPRREQVGRARARPDRRRRSPPRSRRPAIGRP